MVGGDTCIDDAFFRGGVDVSKKLGNLATFVEALSGRESYDGDVAIVCPPSECGKGDVIKLSNFIGTDIFTSLHYFGNGETCCANRIKIVKKKKKHIERE